MRVFTKKAGGVKVAPEHLIKSETSTKASCALSCIQMGDPCKAFSYNQVESICELSDEAVAGTVSKDFDLFW